MSDSEQRAGRSRKRHEDLKAWVACHDLTLAVYRRSAEWPAEERFGLVSQARRAAYSAAANIAEGSARPGARQFRRFLDQSLGSLAELCYIFTLCRDLGYLAPHEWGELEALRDHAGRLAWGLYRSVDRSPVGKPTR